MDYYLIGDIAKMMDLSVSTIRYYDHKGLLPFVDRDEYGVRHFKKSDLIMINTIACLKATGMTLKEIRTYVDWCQEGIDTAPQRLDMFKEREIALKKQMQTLQYTMKIVADKQHYYEEAIEHGTVDVCHDEKMALLGEILAGHAHEFAGK